MMRLDPILTSSLIDAPCKTLKEIELSLLVDQLPGPNA